MGKPKQENIYQLHEPMNILPKNEKQDRFIQSMKRNQLTFGTGSAGTGKTYCAVALACQLLKQSREIDKIVVGRPNVGTGPTLGAFPGEADDKLAKWLVEPINIMQDVLGKGVYECAKRKDEIEYLPLEVSRGRSFINSFVIIDEAQNLSLAQIKMLATRIGVGSRMVFCGDDSQSDNVKGSMGGAALPIFAKLMEDNGVACEHIRFTPDDIVRSGIVRDIVMVCENSGISGLSSQG